MNRVHQIILIGSTILGSWLGMQAVHESGHVLGAWMSGGTVARVVLNPLTISRTDLAVNPFPLFVVWAGPVGGILIPLFVWAVAHALKWPAAFVLRFFAGFCWLANGMYIGIGSFTFAGDCGDMLRHGSVVWQLWLFGIITSPIGMWMWHGQGTHFGLGRSSVDHINPGVAYGTLGACLGLVVLGFVVGGS